MFIDLATTCDVGLLKFVWYMISILLLQRYTNLNHIYHMIPFYNTLFLYLFCLFIVFLVKIIVSYIIFLHGAGEGFKQKKRNKPAD